MNKTTRKHWAKCTTGGGFTLAELLIVVAVIAVLVAVAIPTFGSQLEKSRQSVDLSNLRGAYAAGKLAILNQTDENDNPLYGETASIAFVYDVDSGEFVPKATAAVGADVPASYRCGKATTSSVTISTSGLADVISYKGTLPTSSDSANSNIQKGIVVSFIWSATNHKFTLGSVMFNSKVEIKQSKTPVTLKDSTGTVNEIEKKMSESVDTSAHTIVLALDDLFSYELDPSISGVSIGSVTYAETTTGSAKISQFVPATAGLATVTDADDIAPYAALAFDATNGKITLSKGTASGATDPASGEYTIDGITVKATDAYSAKLKIVLTVG